MPVLPRPAATCRIVLPMRPTQEEQGVAGVAGAGIGLCDDEPMAAAPIRIRPDRAPSRRVRALFGIGEEVARFQEASAGFDDVAARVLAVERADLAVLTLLLFDGAAPVASLAAALDRGRSDVGASVDRLLMAGYARVARGAGGTTIGLTAHAREWIERLWAPLREAGLQLMGRYPTRQLETMRDFMAGARAAQEQHTARVRAWLDAPRSTARRPHRRGGLSPAALHRVEALIDASLDRPLPLAALAARAGLSVAHFSRAFRVSTGETPRAFVAARRIALAERLVREGDDTLAAIADAAGFSSQSRLTTAFRRATGFTPAAYRRARR
jgi:AraC family transcriptional regulator